MRSTFVRTHLSVFAIIVAAFTFNAAVVGAGQAIHHNHQKTEVVDRQHAQRFYGMIDGRIPLAGATVDVALATDLRAAMGDGRSGRLPAAVQNFRGSSTSYGGITDTIGFSPFNSAGQGCQECGPLTDHMLVVLAQIKSGHDSSLFRSVKDTTGTGMTLTPFGISWLAFFLLMWLIVSPLAALAAKMWNPSGYNNLVASGEGHVPWQIIALAPTFWLVQWFVKASADRKAQARVREMFPEQCSAIDAADRVIAHVGGAEARKLADARDQVMAQLQDQAASNGSPANRVELENAMTELHDALDFLSARSQAMKELADPTKNA